MTLEKVERSGAAASRSNRLPQRQARFSCPDDCAVSIRNGAPRPGTGPIGLNGRAIAVLLRLCKKRSRIEVQKPSRRLVTRRTGGNKPVAVRWRRSETRGSLHAGSECGRALERVGLLLLHCSPVPAIIKAPRWSGGAHGNRSVRTTATPDGTCRLTFRVLRGFAGFQDLIRLPPPQVPQGVDGRQVLGARASLALFPVVDRLRRCADENAALGG